MRLCCLYVGGLFQSVGCAWYWTEVWPDLCLAVRDLVTALPFACCSWISVTGQMQSHTAGAKYWLQLHIHEATVFNVVHTLCCVSAASVGTCSDWLNKRCYLPVAALPAAAGKMQRKTKRGTRRLQPDSGFSQLRSGQNRNE